jgi:hypothetical protein
VSIHHGGHPGVVDEDVHAAERIPCGRDDGVHTGLIGEVSDHPFRSDTGDAQLLDPLEDAVRRRGDHHTTSRRRR